MPHSTTRASDWKLFSSNVAPPSSEGYTTHPTREAALSAACQLHWTDRVLRIEGPNGEVISREEIEEYCRSIHR
jgi:hypothetical protein